jgi:PAS domain S-box-containing protein
LGRAERAPAAWSGDESLLASVLDATADGILVVDREGRTVLANKRFAELWRIPDELLLSRDDDAMLAFVLDQLVDPEAFLAKVRELYATPDAAVDAVVFRDGRVYERYSSPRLVGSEIVGRVWSFRDISEHERANRDLAASEDRFRTLVEQLPAITFLDSADATEALYLSPQTREVLGYEPEEIFTFEQWRQVIHPDDVADYVAAIEDAVRRDAPLEHVHRMVRRDGSVIWVREREQVIRDREGRAIQRQGIVVDATAEIESQVQLRRAEELYRGLVEKLPGVTYLWGPAGRCTYVSPQVLDMFGCTEEAFGEGAWRNVIAAEDLERVIDHVRAEHAAGRGAHVEYRIRHPATGEERWLSEQTTMVTVAGETLVQGLILDVTSDIQAAKALEERESERRRLVGSLLRAAEAERVSLAAELHDDTVQILAGAILTVDQIKRDVAEVAPATAARVHRLRTLLAEAMERARTLMFEINPQLLHASGLSAAIQALATELGEAGGFAVAVEGDVGRFPVEVETLAYRIVREAVINAQKHAHCTHLHIRLATADGHLEATVTDDGVGFSPDQALALEDARLHFGLRSVIERARIADGAVTVTSAPGQGATVTLRLPITHSPSAA